MIYLFTAAMNGHYDHIRQVLKVLRDAKLYGNLEKCTFAKDKVIFLGYVVSKNGVEVDSSKIEAIQKLAYSHERESSTKYSWSCWFL